MRRLSAILLTTTAAVTLALGFTSTSFELSNFIGPVDCRSVLAPMEGEILIGSDEVTSDVVEEWLLDVGYDADDGVIPADISYAAEARGEQLCEEARAGRSAAMFVVAVVGFALSTVAFLIPRDFILNPKKN